MSGLSVAASNPVVVPVFPTGVNAFPVMASVSNCSPIPDTSNTNV